jgi:ornithine cyclodeaminase/alanine dehydrogenase-like protein (mu-crystallin family)
MLGVNDATAKDETVARENIAAQNYINALGEYRRSPNAINKQTLDKAKQVLADLKCPAQRNRKRYKR